MTFDNRILLINAGLLDETPYKCFSAPLGILYIAAVLEKNGFSVKILDGDMETDIENSAEKMVKEWQPLWVGISALTPTFKRAIKIAEAVKKASPETTVVMGGHHATYFADRILKTYPFVDMIIRGEGEQAFLEVVQKKEWKKIKGVTSHHQGHLTETPDREPLQNLDELPFPARHLLHHYEYQYSSNFSTKDPRHFSKEKLPQTISVLSSRGCPFSCLYCANTAYAGNKIRLRSAENVIAELKGLLDQGFLQFFFVDDHFLADRKRSIEIAGFLALERKKGKAITWQCMARVDALLEEEFVASLAEAGCRQILFGIESGSEKVLNYYNKKTTKAKIRTAIENTNRQGIQNIASLILGAPVEEFEDIQETSEFLRSIPVDILEINRLIVFPGTKLWDQLTWSNTIDIEETWQGMVSVCDIYGGVSAERLREWSEYLQKSVYENPAYVERKEKEKVRAGG